MCVREASYTQAAGVRAGESTAQTDAGLTAPPPSVLPLSGPVLLHLGTINNFILLCFIILP